MPDLAGHRGNPVVWMAKLCSERWMKDRCDRMYSDVLIQESGREQAEYVVCVAGNVG